MLQGSINTAENTSQVVPAVQPTVHSQTSESVRFAPESENDEKPSHFVRTNTPHPKELMKKKEMLKHRHSNTNLESNRQNSESSNPADSVQALSQQNQTQQQQQLHIISSKTINDSSTLNQQPQLQPQPVATQQTNETILNSMKMITTNRQKSKETVSQSNSLNNDAPAEETAEKPAENGISQNHNNEDENGLSPDEEENQANNRMKHVDFKLSFGNGVVIINDHEEETSPSLPSSPTKLENENENENNSNNNQLTSEIDTSLLSNGSGQFRLRRRDTPHHLKGARLNSPNNKAQQLDPNEMKEILERYTSNNNSNNTNAITTSSSTYSVSADSKLLKPKVQEKKI